MQVIWQTRHGYHQDPGTSPGPTNVLIHNAVFEVPMAVAMKSTVFKVVIPSASYTALQPGRLYSSWSVTIGNPSKLFRDDGWWRSDAYEWEEGSAIINDHEVGDSDYD
jgi:hypothetical protein